MDSTLAKLKRHPINFDFHRLSSDMNSVIAHLTKAMTHMNAIYLRQQDEELPGFADRIRREGTPTQKEFLATFNGPWSTLDGYRSAFDTVHDRRPTCAFYPADLTKAEWEAWLASLSGAQREVALDPCTVIRRERGALRAIPYHEYFTKELVPVCSELRAAAAVSKHPGLSSFLLQRADGLESGDYRASDASWVRLVDSPLEVVIGPFEVYDDGFQGIKASYEAMLLVVDEEKGRELETIGAHVKDLSAAFPVPGNARSAVGGLAPIKVVHQIFSSGEAHAGIHASAFNLPNDAWVRREVGWKQIMILNIMQAKFETCTRPIAERVVEGGGAAAFDPYFYTVLLHEVSHGLGPAYRENGEPVARCMGATYTPIEEAKADVGAIHLLLNCGGRFGVPAIPSDKLLRSYLGGLFRSMRFGLHEAHGAANVLQFNWYEETGVIGKSGTKFTADDRNFARATKELLDKLTGLQAQGTVNDCERFLARYTAVPPHVDAAIKGLKDIPIDIRPEWPTK